MRRDRAGFRIRAVPSSGTARSLDRPTDRPPRLCFGLCGSCLAYLSLELLQNNARSGAFTLVVKCSPTPPPPLLLLLPQFGCIVVESR